MLATGRLGLVRLPSTVFRTPNAVRTNILVRKLCTTPTKPVDACAPAPKAVGYWLLGTAGAVLGMVMLGGATRLTKSGLSMVEWKPHTFTKPSSPEEWADEFDKYKQYPEFKRVNKDMTVDEFKFIYMMEWGHRQLGRLIGVAFVVPAVYFGIRRQIPRWLWPRVVAMFALGGAQGVVGWWMVKSGLDDKLLHNPADPRVSPYRLAAHLGMAFTVYSLLLWTGLDVLTKSASTLSTTVQYTPAIMNTLKSVKPLAAVTTGIVALTVASGAFVAGNDAGHAYNDWPLMAGRFIPEHIWEEKYGLRNFTENIATVQFDHRMLAYTSLIACVCVFRAAQKNPGGLRALPSEVRKSVHSLIGMAATQVGLGISTLMLYVPVSLATVHQGGSMILLSMSLWTYHAVRRHLAAAAAQAARAAIKK